MPAPVIAAAAAKYAQRKATQKLIRNVNRSQRPQRGSRLRSAVLFVVLAAFAALTSLTAIFGDTSGQAYASEGCPTMAVPPETGGSSATPEPSSTTGPSAPTTDPIVAALDEEQQSNAAIIITTAQDNGAGDQGAVVGIATAYQESKLRNLDHGHGSSLGLFQLISAHGTPEQRMDPQFSSTWFYAQLVKVPNWQSMSVTDAAQAVQQSAYPDAYAQWEPMARALVGGAGGGNICGNPGAMNCPPTGLAVEEGLTPDALRVLRCVAQNFGPHTFGGLAQGGHVSKSDHYTGRAVDVMIADWSTTAGVAHGNEVAEWLKTNAAKLGVKNLIWYSKIWSVDRDSEGWRAYSHPEGRTDPTALHLDHVHVSVYGNAAIGDVTAAGPWTLPLTSSYVLTARFGDCGSNWASCHTGLDFAVSSGNTVVAASAGTVTHAGDGGAYGNLIKVMHGTTGIETYYAHNTQLNVTVGQTVTPGQPIATSGATGNVTGPHLHFEVRRNGTPLDPDTWLRDHGLDL